jgi:GntR family transcriptional repressor for pyruvate dehydrogenase complex
VAALPNPDLSEVVLAPARGRHGFESSVEVIATAIRLGVYPRGSSLPPERDLARRMGVSRATLREAMVALRSAGFVTTRRGRGGGTVVCYEPPRPGDLVAAGFARRLEDVRDVLVFRRVVEPGACHVAARTTLSDSRRAMLEAAHAEVANASDPAAHRQADSRFHLAIAALTDSALAIRAVASVQADLHDMLSAIPVLDVNIDHSNKQHRTIVKAILRGEATRARRVMEEHCDDTAALLRGLLT